MINSDGPANHHRRSIRLHGYDYRQAGAYHVTIVAHSRLQLLGQILQSSLQLNANGRIVAAGWLEIASHFAHASLDEFVVMPNHLHGIILISDDVGAGFPRPTPLSASSTIDERRLPSKRPTLGQIIAYLKYQTTKQINAARGMPGVPVWQRNYYEHIVRSAQDLDDIRQYIVNNPAQWALDNENPAYGTG